MNCTMLTIYVLNAYHHYRQIILWIVSPLCIVIKYDMHFREKGEPIILKQIAYQSPLDLNIIHNPQQTLTLHGDLK